MEEREERADTCQHVNVMRYEQRGNEQDIQTTKKKREQTALAIRTTKISKEERRAEVGVRHVVVE